MKARTERPKADLTAALAEALDVSPKAITVPDIDSMDGLMHTLFALEDRGLISIANIDGSVYLHANPTAVEFEERLRVWQMQAERLNAGELAKEAYDRWRHHYSGG